MKLSTHWFAIPILTVLGGAAAQSPTPETPEAPQEAKPKPLVMPTVYEDYRFFVVPETDTGRTLKFLTGTGDKSFIYSNWAHELGVPINLSGTVSTVQLPTFDPAHEIPPSRGHEGYIPTLPYRYRRPYLAPECWGILGEGWFANRIWTLDYPGRKMLMRPVGDLPDVGATHKIALAFRSRLDGGRENNLPRVQVSIAGETLDMLLSTGASAVLEEAVVKQLDDKRPAIRSMSFISQSQFDAWKGKHDWRVIKRAEKGSGTPMMEVPKLSVAGFDVGPIWFMARPDSYCRDQLSRSLDKRVTGELGGNALRFFRVTLDFTGSTAFFEKP